LNLTAGAWRQLRRSWRPPSGGLLLWQSFVAGPLFAVLDKFQDAAVGARRDNVQLSGSIVILGYWRSGTTLLHELLCTDARYAYPTTYACMNPHHFILTQSGRTAGQGRRARRPMDDVQIGAASPQEDEFALLSLGVRSPYEALLFPSHFTDALALSDPDELSPMEREAWKTAFLKFVRGVSLSADQRPVILKSPAHGCRIATLVKLLPNVRFVLITRDPFAVFESAVRMWSSLFGIYAFEKAPSDDEIRAVVLADRMRFEAKLTSGIGGLQPAQIVSVRYEELVREPLRTLENVYAALELGDFAKVRGTVSAEIERLGTYVARNEQPAGKWRERVADEWRDIFAKYGYAAE